VVNNYGACEKRIHRGVINSLAVLQMIITDATQTQQDDETCELRSPQAFLDRIDRATSPNQGARRERLERRRDNVERRSERLSGNPTSGKCSLDYNGTFNCGELLGKNFGVPDTLRAELDFQLRRFASQCNNSIYWTVEYLLQDLNGKFDDCFKTL
jgi:hypothetical protein